MLKLQAKLEFTDQYRIAALRERWIVAIGYSELSNLVHTRKETLQRAIRRLIKKNFVDIVEEADAAKLKCRVYRIYTLEQVLVHYHHRSVKYYRKVGGGRVLVIEAGE